MSNKLLVKVTGEEYPKLLNKLGILGYHWKSGQTATTLLAFSKLKDNEVGIRVIDPDKKTIGICPIEILSKSERNSLLADCVSVDFAVEKLKLDERVSQAEHMREFCAEHRLI